MRSREIEAKASRLLGAHDLFSGPIDVEGLAKRLNVEVRYEPLEDHISGFLVLRDRAIIGVNSLHSINRKRFTIAHELGHFILHGGGDSQIFVDQIQVRYRDATSSAGAKRSEVEANTFAAAILMPEKLIRRDLDARGRGVIDESEIRRLSADYLVSQPAMTYRLVNLDLLDSSELFQVSI